MILDVAQELAKALVSRRISLVTAESCTAGLVAASLAELSGASAYLWGGFICYSNEAKVGQLGVDPEVLEQKGAVSREAALAMAEGALHASGATLAVSVTGLAGPEGDGSGVPVGTVWIATALAGAEPFAIVRRYAGDRNEVRVRATLDALGDAVRRLDTTATLS